MTGNAPTVPSIDVEDAAKWYGSVMALQRCSFRLEAGVWSLVGPNGAGKSTLMRLLAGQIRPSLGSVRVCGLPPFRNLKAARLIGWCPSTDGLYEELTALEFVRVLAELSGQSAAAAAERSRVLLVALGLADQMNQRLGGFSRGMRQRVKLAQSLVDAPPVLLLDEPFAAMDAESRQRAHQLLRAHADTGALVLISTHLLNDAALLSDRVLMLFAGRVVAQGSVHELQALLDDQPQRIRITCAAPRRLAQHLAAIPSLKTLRFQRADVLELESSQPDVAYSQVIASLLEDDCGLQAIDCPDADLEGLFRSLMQRQARVAKVSGEAK